MNAVAMPLVVMIIAASACAVSAAAASSAPALGDSPAATVHPELWPQPRWPYAPDPQLEARVASLRARMTLAEKVGQVIQADIASVTPDDVRRYHLGSILNGGNSAPGGDEFAAPAKWLALADAFYDASVDRAGGRTAIPILWGTDAVHGHSNIVGATLFPHNIGLGAAHDPALLERIAAATAAEIRTTGMEWTFAPTVTVPQDLRWGRAYEGYSEDPALVASYAGRFIRGLQGPPGGTPILAGPHVIASTKHFLADGATFEGRDQGDARIDEATLRDVHGAPYVEAIEAGVQTIMASFSSWNGAKITGSRGLLTDVLRQRMRFGGFIISDWNAHGQVAGCSNASCPQAINAGLDMYMAPDSWKPLYASLLAQVQDGTVPMARLDDAVGNILRVKLRAGLFEAGRPSSRPLAGRFELLGSAEHRALAREAVRKSLVLMKNADQLLPLLPGKRILVAGDGADDLSRQAGGWTITWQGTGVPNDKLVGATSIWEGIRAAVTAAGGTAQLAPDGGFTTRPDAAIVVFGETPYAEFQGDLKTLQLKTDAMGPLRTMQRLKAAGIPVVALYVGGRPLWTNREFNAADAFVAAWLPGSEGAGIADMLFRGLDGKVAHAFSGTLSFGWPATAQSLGPRLFKTGYGLTTASRVPFPTLSEDPGVGEDSDSGGIFFDKGAPASAWSLQVTDGAGDITRITNTPADAVAGRVRITATDHLTQEGARRFAWRGDGPATVELASQAPVDVSRETNGDVMLLMTVRIDTAPSRQVSVTARSAGGSHGTVALPIDTLRRGEWQTVGVALKCFATAGADMTRIDAPFQLTTAGALTLSLSRVALGTVADIVVPCAKRP